MHKWLLPALILLLFSCSKQDSRIQGTWMCSYLGYWDGDSLKYEQPCLRLIDIDSDTIHQKSFRYPQFNSEDGVISNRYEFNDGKIYFNNDSIVFEIISQDSLVIRSNSQEGMAAVLKRIPEIQSPELVLPKAFYELTCNTYVDSFEVLDNNFVLHQNEKWAHDGDISRWYVSNYKHYKFLVIARAQCAPLLLTEVSPGNINFKLFDQDVYDGTIKEVDYPKEQSNILGVWHQESALHSWSTFLPYLHSSNNIYGKDTIVTLIFDNDSVEVKQYGSHGKHGYTRSKSGKHILLDLPDSLAQFSQWRIELDDDSTMNFFNGSPGRWTLGMSDQVYFKKTKQSITHK